MSATAEKLSARDILDESDSDSDDDLLNYDAFSQTTLSQNSTSSAQAFAGGGDDSPVGKQAGTAAAAARASPKSPASDAEAGGDSSGVLEVKEEDNRLDEKTIEKKATRKAKISFVPTDVQSPSQLYFHRTTRKKITKYHPCRERHPDQAKGLDLQQEWDQKQKVLVQYIDFPRKMGDHILVPRASLVPFHGGDDGSEIKDGTVIGTGTGDNAPWCPKLCRRYIEQLRKDRRVSDVVELRAQTLFLGRILESARTRAAEDKQSKKRKEREEVYEEQQPESSGGGSRLFSPPSMEDESDVKAKHGITDDEALVYDGTNSGSDDSDSDGGTGFQLDNGRKKELIRPGDVIEYYSHVYVAGDKRGYRSATVLSVDPKRKPILVLDIGEVLPKDTQIRRTKRMHRGALEDYDGVYRPISDFKLTRNVPSGAGVAAGIRKEADRVGSVIQKHMADFEEKTKADGFAPMDLLNYRPTGADKGDQREGEVASITPPNPSPQKQDCAEAESMRAERKRQREQQLEALRNEEGPPGSDRKRRRGGPSPHMTADQLRLASKVEDVIENKWGKMIFKELLKRLEEALEKLESQVGNISCYRLEKFLESDTGRHISVRQHGETENELNRWLTSIGEGVEDGRLESDRPRRKKVVKGTRNEYGPNDNKDYMKSPFDAGEPIQKSSRIVPRLSCKMISQMFTDQQDIEGPTVGTCYRALPSNIRIDRNCARHLYRNFHGEVDIIGEDTKSNLPISRREVDIMVYCISEGKGPDICHSFMPYRVLDNAFEEIYNEVKGKGYHKNEGHLSHVQESVGEIFRLEVQS